MVALFDRFIKNNDQIDRLNKQLERLTHENRKIGPQIEKYKDHVSTVLADTLAAFRKAGLLNNISDFEHKKEFLTGAPQHVATDKISMVGVNARSGLIANDLEGAAVEEKGCTFRF